MSVEHVSQGTERWVSPQGLTIPKYASRTRNTPAQFRNPTEEASSARVDVSQQAESSSMVVQSLRHSPATSQPQSTKLVNTPEGTQQSTYSVHAQMATQNGSQQNEDEDIDVMEAQVRILEQVHSCLAKYGPQMPQVAQTYQAREWFMQHSSNDDKVRFVAACLKRDEAESNYLSQEVEKDRTSRIAAVNLLNREPAKKMSAEETAHEIGWQSPRLAMWTRLNSARHCCSYLRKQTSLRPTRGQESISAWGLTATAIW